MAVKLNESKRNIKHSTCVRNVGKFKIYADHFNAALPYTNYFVEDTETGKVMEYLDHPSYIKSVLGELVEQVAKYGFGEPPAPKEDADAFDPLAGL